MTKGRSGSAPTGGKAGGVYTFSQLERDSVVGLRKGDGLGGGAGASVTSGPTKTGHLGGFTAIAPTKKPPKASMVATASRPLDAPKHSGPPSARALGGGSGAASDREKRLAYFEAQAAAKAAKK